MIDRNHDLTLTRQAKLLGMSRGSVYYLPRSTSAAELDLMRRLDELHLNHPAMGSRMLRDQLAMQGIQVGRRHVRTRRFDGWDANWCTNKSHRRLPCAWGGAANGGRAGGVRGVTLP